jgi:hypothetical protein
MAKIPHELITNIHDKSVVLTPELETGLPDVKNVFKEIDEIFLNNPEKYLQNLEASMFSFKSSEGGEVACSLIHGDSSKGDEILILFAPFSDRDIKSSSDKLHDYIVSSGSPGMLKKELAAPNSWNQTTKSSTVYEMLSALGSDIPVLTIYSPLSSGIYSANEREQIRNGDFSPAGRITKEALAVAQAKLHGLHTETKLDKAHISGASLGASNAIGAAFNEDLNQQLDIQTVTAQELIMGPKNLGDLAKRFTVKPLVGEDSNVDSSNNDRINETAMRKIVDAHGSELIGTTARMIKGMKPTYMRGLTKPEITVRAIEELLDNSTSLLVALAENSSLTHETPSYLPNSREKLITLKAEKGQRLGHIVDEHVALSALVTILNIKNK